MSLDKQAIALSKIGCMNFPRKDTDAPTDEIYDKGFVVLDEKIRWDKATDGIAKECVENAEKYFVAKFLCRSKELAKRGGLSATHPFPDVSLDCIYRIARILEADGFFMTVGVITEIDWSQASFGKALEYREIAQDFKAREKK